MDSRGDLQLMEWGDALVSGILYNHVLAHVRDEEAALREQDRVLKLGGMVILTTSLDYSREKTLELEKTNILDAWRLHAFDLAGRFEQHGFKAEWIELNQGLVGGRAEKLHALIARKL